jgi:hypothetical protein
MAVGALMFQRQRTTIRCLRRASFKGAPAAPPSMWTAQLAGAA